MKKLILLCALITSMNLVSAQTQMLRWAMPGRQINFGVAGTSPTVSTLGPTGGYSASNAATNDAGNLIFYIKDRKVYDASSTLAGTFNDINGCTAPDPELAIVPVPGVCKKYYIIFASNDLAGGVVHHTISYGIIDVGGGSPVITTQTTELLTPNSNGIIISVGFAVSKLVGGTKRFLYCVGRTTVGFVTRFEITSTGIGSKTNLVSGSTPGISSSVYFGDATEVDLSPDGTKLAWTSGEDADVNFLSLNSTTGALISASYKQLNSNTGEGYGVEWNATSTAVYISHSSGIRRVTYSGLVETAIASSSAYNNTHLEMGRDGYIYGSKNDGSSLGIINTSTNTVSASPLVIGDAGKQVNFGAFYTLPDQIDGEQYQYTFDPQNPVDNFKVNNNYIRPDIALNVCNTGSILMNFILYSSNVTDYKISIYNASSSGVIGSLVTATQWLSISTLGSSVNLEDLPGTPTNDTWLSNHTGYFMVRLEVKNLCSEIGTCDGLLNVLNIPNDATSQFSFNDGSALNPPITPSTVYSSPTPLGHYGGSVNGNLSTGYVTFFYVKIEEISCATGAVIAFVGQTPSVAPPTMGDASSISGYSINGIAYDATGTPGYFADNATWNKCYKLTYYVGNPCGTNSSYGYFTPSLVYRLGDTGNSSSNSNTFNERVRIMPNPNNGSFFIDGVELDNVQKIEINDVTGKTIQTINSPSLSDGKIFMDAKNIGAGIYTLNVITTSKNFVSKFSLVK